MPRMPTERPHSFGSGPIEERHYELMNALAGAIDGIFNGDPPVEPKKTGFVLMVFPLGPGDDHRCNYISNAERKDIIIMMKEQLRYFEGMPDDLSGRG